MICQPRFLLLLSLTRCLLQLFSHFKSALVSGVLVWGLGRGDLGTASMFVGSHWGTLRRGGPVWGALDFHFNQREAGPTGSTMDP